MEAPVLLIIAVYLLFSALILTVIGMIEERNDFISRRLDEMDGGQLPIDSKPRRPIRRNKS